MANLNKVLLIGNLTRDPEVRYTPKGQAVADIGLATNRKWTDESGDHEEACFLNCVAWGKQAEAAGKYLSKGREVFIEGRLKYETWERDGQKRNAIKVVVERIQFLGGAKEDRGEGAQADARTDEPSGTRSAGPELEDDDIPF